MLINTRTHLVFGGLRSQVRHFTDEMAPTFTKQQLDGLPAYHMAITTLVDNRPALLFEAAVEPIPTGNPALAAQLRAQCRHSVGQPRAQTERLVAPRYGRLPDVTTRKTKDATIPTPPEEPGSRGMQASAPEPLDGRDPNPRDGGRRRGLVSGDPSLGGARGGSIGGPRAGSRGASNAPHARRELHGRASGSRRT